MTTPEPGQVWADNDPRVAGRTIQIAAIEGDVALCTVLTNSDADQRDIDLLGSHGPRGRYVAGGWVPGDRRGATTRVRLSRLRPTSTGFRLIEETR
jgi:hypothetical protein